MNYSIENIPSESKFLFFWGHQPSRDGSISKTCFSQWWLSPFMEDGVEYKTTEHWMMAKKAKLFHDYEILDQILNAKSPAEVKKLRRAIKNYDDEIWLQNRFTIVKKDKLLKFSQNESLKKLLLHTNARIIVEASPVDAIWGIGMARDHSDATNPQKWQGLNLLGFALMEVRDELQK